MCTQELFQTRLEAFRALNRSDRCEGTRAGPMLPAQLPGLKRAAAAVEESVQAKRFTRGAFASRAPIAAVRLVRG